MDLEAIYKQTINKEWILKYLDNDLLDLGYHKLLCMTHSDKPTKSEWYQQFLYKLPCIKYTWDSQPEAYKQRVLSELQNELAKTPVF